MAPKRKELAEEAAPAESGETQEGLKKPPTAYWLWLEKNRAAISEEAGTKKPPIVAKLAGEKWKALPEKEKKPFEKVAAEKKAEYDAAIAGGAQKRERKSKKSKEEPDAKKARKPRAPGAYWLWLADNRERIGKEIGTKVGPAVSTEAGKQWNAVADDVREKYQKMAAEKKEEMANAEAEALGGA
ncbi:DNA binding domain [Amphidinium carterae]|eukprot:39829-Amphidinium_carterae.1